MDFIHRPPTLSPGKHILLSYKIAPRATQTEGFTAQRPMKLLARFDTRVRCFSAAGYTADILVRSFVIADREQLAAPNGIPLDAFEKFAGDGMLLVEIVAIGMRVCITLENPTDKTATVTLALVPLEVA
jgi:hypothetical protein